MWFVPTLSHQCLWSSYSRKSIHTKHLDCVQRCKQESLFLQETSSMAQIVYLLLLLVQIVFGHNKFTLKIVVWNCDTMITWSLDKKTLLQHWWTPPPHQTIVHAKLPHHTGAFFAHRRNIDQGDGAVAPAVNYSPSHQKAIWSPQSAPFIGEAEEGGACVRALIGENCHILARLQCN